MANFPSVTAAGAFESPAVQNAIKALAEQSVYDSGLRNVSQYLNTGWSGSLYAKRVAGRVTFQFVDVKRTEAGGSTAVVSVPGFQPLGVDQAAVGYLGDGDGETPSVMYRARVTQYGASLVDIPVGTGLTGDLHFNTTRGLPSNPPGIPA